MGALCCQMTCPRRDDFPEKHWQHTVKSSVQTSSETRLFSGFWAEYSTLSMFALSQVIWAAQSAKLQKHLLGLSYQAVCNGAALEENRSVIVLTAVPVQLVICDGEIRVLTELLLPCQQMKSKWKYPNYQQPTWKLNYEPWKHPQCYKDISSLQKKTAGILPSILFFFFPYNFLPLLNEITFLLSSAHASNPSLLKLSNIVGPGEEGTLEARRRPELGW